MSMCLFIVFDNLNVSPLMSSASFAYLSKFVIHAYVHCNLCMYYVM